MKRRRFAQVYFDWLVDDELSYGCRVFITGLLALFGAKRHIRITKSQAYLAEAFNVDRKQIKRWIDEAKRVGYIEETDTGLALLYRDKLTPSTGSDRWLKRGDKMSHPQTQSTGDKMSHYLYRENIQEPENLTQLQDVRARYEAKAESENA